MAVPFAVAAELPTLPPQFGNAIGSVPVVYQDFEVLPIGWAGCCGASPGSIIIAPSGYANSGGYADGIASNGGGHHARLGVSAGCAQNCGGATTRWVGYAGSAAFPPLGYGTSVAIYLDAAWAAAHPDKRFDWSSAIAQLGGQHMRDFVFNVGTDPGNVPNPGHPGGHAQFVVSASTNALRSGAYPANPDKSPVAIAESGWYVFRHTFRDEAGSLAVDLEILKAGAPVASWTIRTGDAIDGAGGALYGWFANNEIHDLAIDDSLWMPCRAALPPPALECLA